MSTSSPETGYHHGNLKRALLEAALEMLDQEGADGVLRQDFSVVQAFILVSAFIYVVANLVVDVIAGAIDPRVRHAGGRP